MAPRVWRGRPRLRFDERIQPTAPGRLSVSLAHWHAQPHSFSATQLERQDVAGANAVLLGGVYVCPHHLLLIAVILFLNWLLTECRAVGMENKRAGICSVRYRINIFFIQNKITSCSTRRRTNKVCYFPGLYLLLLLLSRFTQSPEIPGSVPPLPPCSGTALPSSAGGEQAVCLAGPRLIAWLACLR